MLDSRQAQLLQIGGDCAGAGGRGGGGLHAQVLGRVHALPLSDGRICLTNNAAERVLRGIALGRRSWLFAGSDTGGDRQQRCIQ